MTHTSECVSIDLYKKNSVVCISRWLSGRAQYNTQWVGHRTCDPRVVTRGFEARPWRCYATTLGKLFTPHCLIHAILHEEDCELLIKSKKSKISLSDCDEPYLLTLRISCKFCVSKSERWGSGNWKVGNTCFKIYFFVSSVVCSCCNRIIVDVAAKGPNDMLSLLNECRNRGCP